MKSESLLCEVPGAILVALVELMVGWLQGWQMYGFIRSTVYQWFSKRCEKWESAALTLLLCMHVKVSSFAVMQCIYLHIELY